MRSCWVLSGMISVSIRLAWLKALHYSIVIVTTFHCCVCCCCYCYYFLCFVVSQHQVCLTCFHAGIWEHVPKDAIIAGESSHPWKYSSCKLKCYSLVILHVVHIFLSIKKSHITCCMLYREVSTFASVTIYFPFYVMQRMRCWGFSVAPHMNR